MSDSLPTPTRRTLIAGTASLAAAAGLGTFASVPAALAQKKPEGPDEISLEELMKPGGLPEMAIGDPKAKVTIVEYASMTCGHCAAFHNKTFPEIKAKYVDTGKVYFILREFPLENLSAGAFMLARCAGGEKTYPLVGVLFQRQDEWAVRNNPTLKLFEIAKQAGFTEESFKACLTDQALLEKISAVRQRADDKFGVRATPTFFINGRRMKTPTYLLADFDKVLEPLLKGS